MAKKKTKREKKKAFAYSTELYGVLLLLAGIIGIGKYGPVGNLISAFAVFLVGVFYNILLILLLILGGYLIIKREWPNFFTTKMLGFYLFMIGILSLMHEEYIAANNYNGIKVFQETVDQLTVAFSSLTNSSVTPDIIGGGIIGCTFSVLFTSLFSYNGMKIVAWTLCIAGISLFTGFSIADFVKNTSSKAKEMLPKKEKKEKESVQEKEPSFDSNKKPVITGASDEPVKEEKKVTISSIDQLTKINTKEEPVIKTEIPVEQPVERQVIIHNGNYELPPISILNPVKNKKSKANEGLVEKNIETLEKVLKDFGVIGKVVEVHIGPTVTQYELELQTGTKLNKVLSIHKEIALVLAAKDIRIEAPIPGKSTVGIEIPNSETTPVSFREVMEKVPASKSNSKLLCPLGKNIMGNVVWCEIDKTPHLLVAGSTGSGKSVCINGIIASILMRTRPDEVKLVMVDPKKVELSVYNGVPHLLCPVVTDPKKASVALNKIVAEMERRYEVFEESHTKNIATYNSYIDDKNKDLDEDSKIPHMPYIVVIVDELADLMLVASKDVEAAIMRITQMARAAGIHLIIATQRPSTDVITGVVKANIPSRISFAVSSGIDSRTILDSTGAEKLLGKGDMLFLPMGEASPQRIQGAFIADDEIKKIIDYTVEQQKAEYDAAFLNLEASSNMDKSASQREDMEQIEDDDDELYNDVVTFVVEQQNARASLLQRRYKVGYNRAARIIDLLEERGIIGPANGSKPREVLVKLDGEEE